MIFHAQQAEGADPYEWQRKRMVTEQIARRGVRDARVLAAMERVPRHAFVPDRDALEAYGDYPLPIGQGQTISQPYIVAFMVEALELPAGGRVLEIGTGSGYQAAVLAAMGCEVFTIEIVPVLAEQAKHSLERLGYEGVRIRVGDGTRGWPEEAPFDGIVVAAAPGKVPAALLEQIGPDGRLVIPVGRSQQELWRYRRSEDGFAAEELLAVRFVPMTGAAE